MAPVSVMPRLGFWSSISPPGRPLFFSAFVCVVTMCKGLRNDLDLAAMCKGFKEMWWLARLCARVLKTLFVAFAGLVAMHKGLKGNVQLLLLCARVL